MRSLLPLLALAAALPVAAARYETQEHALARLFPPPARVVREERALTPAQRTAAARAAGAPVESALVTRYAGYAPGGAPLGVAYFDRHRVRTGDEVLAILIGPDGAVASVDVLAFGEPEDYLPRPGWLKRFAGRRERGELHPGRALAHVTGATLTTRAIAAAVRRILALHELLGAPAAPAPPASAPVAPAPAVP